MNILVVGYSAHDVIVPVAGLPEPDTKTEVADIIHGGGGPGATAAVCLARLGARVRLATMLGDDDGGRQQRRELEAAGVECDAVRVAAGERSARAVILVDPVRETRTVLWSRGSLPPLPADAVDLAWLDGADLLYHDGHEPAAGLVLAAAARARGLPVVYDAGTVREGSAELVAASSDVISSRGFAGQLTACDDPVEALRRLRRRGPGRVAMTLGEQGVLALDESGREALHIAAFDVRVRDTTGAGDAFHAGYAFGRARGDAWVDCLELGAAVAALKCRDWGGRRGLPTLAEAEALRREGRRR
ncbi:MAG: PfkB family carbohydrate kinase [Candidatus Krumholzibacteriia bacterium]